MSPRWLKRLCFLSILGMCAILLLPFAGCRRGDEEEESSSQSQSQAPELPQVQEYPVKVFGREAQSQPVRVVSLSPAITELLCAFGYGDRLFGVSSACDYPEMVEELPRCGTSVLPDMEQISRVNPDYLLTETPLQIEDYWQLADLDVDVQVMEISPPQSFDQLLELYRDICILMDGAYTGQETGERLAEHYAGQLDALKEKVSSDPSGGTMSAVFIIDPSGITATGDTLYHEVLSVLGLKNLEGNASGFQGTAGEKQPDLVLYGENLSREEIRSSEVFGGWAAVREERMVPVPMSPLERMSPRLFDMLEQLANRIYTATWVDAG